MYVSTSMPLNTLYVDEPVRFENNVIKCLHIIHRKTAIKTTTLKTKNPPNRAMITEANTKRKTEVKIEERNASSPCDPRFSVDNCFGEERVMSMIMLQQKEEEAQMQRRVQKEE